MSIGLGSSENGEMFSSKPTKGPAPPGMSMSFNLVCLMRGCLCLILLDSLVIVADRIDGPYNVDTVIGTIHMRLSEAISNLQENKDSITAKVSVCAWAWLRIYHV